MSLNGSLRRSKNVLAASIVSFVILAGCDEDSANTSVFALQFAATANGKEIGCSDMLAGLGPDGLSTVGVSDLRFYVSNITFTDAEGNPVGVTLDDNEFQYNSEDGSVALIDMTSNTEGSCADVAVAFGEGTARANTVITGMTVVEDVASVSFDVGVSQPLMKTVIATNTAESAPSPLNEMYWTWATGYRHFIMNFLVETEAESGAGFLHIGSQDCGPEDGLALEDREACGFVNTPQVSLADFDLETSTVTVDVPELLAGLDFRSPIYDPKTFEVIGEGPGVECHSSPTQPDCEPIFTNVGLDPATGAANSASNDVFATN